MKKKIMNRYLFFLSFIVFSFFACEEIPPIVTGSMPGETGPPGPPTEQKRQVLIEEFTGVTCVNCPNGSIVIEELLVDHGPQLIAISIHTGQFALPHSQSQYDFRTPEGDNIINYVGQPFGFPTGVVNRRHFDGQFSLQLGSNEWAGFIAEEMAIDPKVKIDIQPAFNTTTRNATVDVILFIEENITDPDVRLSVFFTESGIEDYQTTPTGDDLNYIHKHVLRGMATTFDGIPITGNLLAGGQIDKSFDYTIPTEWVEDKVSIVVMVSVSSGDKKDVLQAHEVHLVE